MMSDLAHRAPNTKLIQPVLSHPARRWSLWASLLRGRHGLIARRRHGTAMTFVGRAGRPTPGGLWLHVAWSLGPRVQLEISPILRESVWLRGPRGGQVSGTSAAPIGQVQRAHHLLGDDDRLAVALRTPTVLRQAAPAVAAVRSRLESGADTPRFDALQRAIARTGPDASGTDIAHTRHAFTVAARTLITRQRMIGEHRRVDERAARPAQRVTARPGRAAEQRAADATLAAAQSAIAAERSRAYDHRPEPPAPLIDVGQLADQVIRQIDRRIVAQRERLGRAF